MFKVIRFGTGFDPVIMISLADVGLNTQETKYYRLSVAWRTDDPRPLTFEEISKQEANRYFSGVADGMGFEKPPEKNFPNLDAVAQFVRESREEWARRRLERAG